jgi:hypothetical protein
VYIFFLFLRCGWRSKLGVLSIAATNLTDSHDAETQETLSSPSSTLHQTSWAADPSPRPRKQTHPIGKQKPRKTCGG